jgi:hypothetical protein
VTPADEPLVAQIDTVEVDPCARKLRGELLGVLPVGRDAALVKKTRVAKRERAGADGAVAFATCGDAREPAYQPRVGLAIRQGGAAGHQREIEGAPRSFERIVGDERHAIRGAQCVRFRAQQRHLVMRVARKKLVGFRKDIHRSCDIECLHSGKDRNSDAWHRMTSLRTGATCM